MLANLSGDIHSINANNLISVVFKNKEATRVWVEAPSLVTSAKIL